MADAGSIWEQSIAGFGQNVAKAIEMYKQKHDQIDQSDKYVQMLATTPQMDASGNPIPGKMLMDEKSHNEYLKQAGSERSKWMGAYLASQKMQQDMQNSIPHFITDPQSGARFAKIGNRVFQIDADKTAGEQARTEAAQSRRKLTDVQIAQQLGILPKPQQAPTGGQIAVEQRSERAARLNERKDIETRIATQGILDPQILLDDKAVSYVTKGSVYGFNKSDDPSKATHVQFEDGKVKTIGQFQRLRKEAEKWRDLGKSPDQIPNVPPQASQLLISNPTPQIRAFFDQKYGQGASDTILKSVQPSGATATEKDPAADAEDEGE